MTSFPTSDCLAANAPPTNLLHDTSNLYALCLVPNQLDITKCTYRHTYKIATAQRHTATESCVYVSFDDQSKHID